jgi:3-oxoacyl-[acyl-carrier-protein] synthase II
MKAYINGIGALAPQLTLADDQFLDQIENYDTNRLQIIKINYRDYIDPKVLRRMSKIVRMSMVSAKVALADASLENADAIITGTGMGCQIDTEKFLNALLENNESMLNPTAFIQSTHNTMGAQIALMNGNNNYNLTFVHRTFSFESALLDSLMMLNENEAKNILLGGIDEITEESWLIKTRIGFFKKNALNNLGLLDDKQTGALAGESVGFFVLSKNITENTYAEIAATSTFFKPGSIEEIEARIKQFLQENKLDPASLDLAILGYNGDSAFDKIYHTLEQSIFNTTSIAYYKHLCGEHDTSSAFAMWIAAKILKSGHIPPIVLKEKSNIDQPQNILIYNQFRNTNHSLILLRKPE